METIEIIFVIEHLFLAVIVIIDCIYYLLKRSYIIKSINDMPKGTSLAFRLKDWSEVFFAVKMQLTPTHVKINSDNPAFLIVYKDE